MRPFVKPILSLLAFFFLVQHVAVAQNDTIAIRHYDLKLDIGHQQQNTIIGKATLDITLLQASPVFRLDFLRATIDSLALNGQPLSDSDYTYDGRHLLVSCATLTVGNSAQLEVFYRTAGCIEQQNWGGFHFDNTIYYNLGVAFSDFPHSYGRSWYPCLDNFTSKSTYSFTYTSPVGWTTTCSGIKDSSILNTDGSETSYWTLDNPTPTYLISVSVGPFSKIERSYRGEYGTYPAIIAYRNQDSTAVARAFDQLDSVVPMFERCFGPYRWGTIGYTGTTKGSMEHVNNISLVNGAMSSMERGYQNVMAHELSHAWFGNLVTCASSYDMWMQEGGASFCEEVAAEAAYGKEVSMEVYQDNLLNVLLTTHLQDDGYKPLYGHTPDYTYGSTVYNKGATVWHSLRGYLGDELFYSTMRQFFEHNAFRNITSQALQDSLSLYSGVDLTDFFAFHVFQPGFVDYHLDHFSTREQDGKWLTTVTVRYKLHGNDSDFQMNGHRIDVTLFNGRRPFATHTLAFDGVSTTQTFESDLRPDFALLDYHMKLSDAVSEEVAVITEKAPYDMARAFVKISPSKTDDTAFIHVAHHFCRPDGEYTDAAVSNPHILRMANRYWVVSGLLPEESVSGRTYFSYGTSQYLDNGFYNSSATLDSLYLLYREDSHHPWQTVKTKRTGNAGQGTLLYSRIRLGEYTLAVMDQPTYESILQPEQGASKFVAYPNPSQGKITIKADVASDRLHISVATLSGTTLIEKQEIANGQPCDIRLNPGTYIISVHTPSGTSLGSQTIVVQ